MYALAKYAMDNNNLLNTVSTKPSKKPSKYRLRNRLSSCFNLYFYKNKIYKLYLKEIGFNFFVVYRCINVLYLLTISLKCVMI